MLSSSAPSSATSAQACSFVAAVLSGSGCHAAQHLLPPKGFKGCERASARTGESQEDIRPRIKALYDAGIGGILDYGAALFLADCML